MTRFHLRWRALRIAGGLMLAGPLLAGCLYDPWQPGSKPPLLGDQVEPPRVAERYCYRTLAEVECYSHRLPAQQGRRMDQAYDQQGYPAPTD